MTAATSTRGWLLALLAFALAVACTAGPTTESASTDRPGQPATSAARPAAPPDPPRGWVGPLDQPTTLQPAPTAAAPAGTVEDVVIVHPDRRRQQFDGYGAALTEASARLINGLPEPQRTGVVRQIVDPRDGAGIDVVRVPMGASDFATSHYTYDDVPAGSTDPHLSRFSIAPDERDTIPVLRDGLAVNPHLQIIGTPWTAPAWMKTNQSLYGGTLDGAWFGAYAQYFVRFVQGYAEKGITIAAVEVQNEPQHEASDYPTMVLDASRAADFVAHHLGPALRAAGLQTRILGYGENWDDTTYPATLLSDDAAAAHLSGVSFHCYAGDVGAQGRIHDRFPHEEIHVTECSGGTWAPDMSANLLWNAENLLISAPNLHARTVLLWNLALDPGGGPHRGGCNGCRGVLTIDPHAGTITANVEWTVLALGGRVTDPNASRVETTVTDPELDVAAFANADGSSALLVLNTASRSRTFMISAGARAFTAVVPPASVASYRW